MISCRENDNVKNKSNLLKQYKDTSFRELYVYPDTLDNCLNYFFKGLTLDSTTFNYLNENVTNSQPLTEGFYSIFSFKINENNIGLITRTPGTYSPTLISLWIYNLKKDSITNNVQLADIFGDAGSAQTINSFLYFDKQNQLNAVQYKYYSYDHSIEEQKDTAIETYRYYYLLKIGNNTVDTISTDSTSLNLHYKHQIEKMGSY